MNRTRALVVSLAVALAAVFGVVALGQTLTLGQQARSTSDRQVSQRNAQLDRYEASLRKALAQKPPALPPLPDTSNASAPVQSAAPVRVVYHRPPPVVVVHHRAGEESDEAFEGGASDD